MMMKSLTLVCVLVLEANAFGQQAAVSSDLRANMKVGQNVTVRLTDGSELKGSVMELTDAQLGIATGRGTERIAAPRIQEVSWRRRDSLWNGLILGAAGG